MHSVSIKFETEFQAPIVRAQFDVLLALAEVIGPSLADLYRSAYMSHMLPRNNHLSKSVREVWLSSALFWEHDNEPGDQATRQVRSFLWERFRRELGKFFDPKDLEFFGPLKLDHVAERIRYYSESTFWNVTKAILECPDTKDNAAVIDFLLRELVNLSPQELKAGLDLGPADWPLLQDSISG